MFSVFRVEAAQRCPYRLTARSCTLLQSVQWFPPRASVSSPGPKDMMGEIETLN